MGLIGPVAFGVCSRHLHAPLPCCCAPAAGTGDVALCGAPFASFKAVASRRLFLICMGADAPSPCDLVVEVCRMAKASRQSGSRFVSRLYPVEYVCFASMDKIGELAERVVAKHFGEGAPATQVRGGWQSVAPGAAWL